MMENATKKTLREEIVDLKEKIMVLESVAAMYLEESKTWEEEDLSDVDKSTIFQDFKRWGKA